MEQDEFDAVLRYARFRTWLEQQQANDDAPVGYVKVGADCPIQHYLVAATGQGDWLVWDREAERRGWDSTMKLPHWATIFIHRLDHGDLARYQSVPASLALDVLAGVPDVPNEQLPFPEETPHADG